jgi:hypothetical protein
MTGNNFAPRAVARAVELIRAGIDPHELRRQVHHEHQELTAQGRRASDRHRAPGDRRAGPGETDE